ncbi:uncharacterized protein LOC144437987 [Glandiceps talaboti]
MDGKGLTPDRTVWLYGMKEGLGRTLLDRYLTKRMSKYDLHMIDDKHALLTYIRSCDSDQFVEDNHPNFQVAKCDKTIWKGKADITETFSKFISQLQPAKRRLLNDTGTVRIHNNQTGVMYVQGSLNQIHDFEKTLEKFADQMMERSQPGFVSYIKDESRQSRDSRPRVTQKPKILERFKFEIAPWTYHFCPAVEDHARSLVKEAGVALSNEENKVIISGSTIAQMSQAESILSSIVFGGSDSPKSSEVISGENVEGEQNPEMQNASGLSASVRMPSALQERAAQHHQSLRRGDNYIQKCLEDMHFSMKTAEDLKVSIKFGDITREKADVIVNGSNPYLQHDGGLARAISERGGRIIQEE